MVMVAVQEGRGGTVEGVKVCAEEGVLVYFAKVAGLIV